MINLSNPT